MDEAAAAHPIGNQKASPQFYPHKPKSVMIRLLRAAKVSPEMIQGAQLYRCENCAELSRPMTTGPAALPGPYEFNHEVLVDVLDEQETLCKLHRLLSIICNGTTFHQVVHIGEGKGQPSSRRCLNKFIYRWGSWAGWPKLLGSDRGFHNR